MKLMQLGESDLKVTRVALGCMRLSDVPEEAMSSVQAALDAGMNFFDHADIYGGGGKEKVFSHLWEQHPHLRHKILLQSKCGIRFPGTPHQNSPGRYDFSYGHILQSVEGSLQRLKTDYLDVLLLHRPDPLIEPEEVANAFSRLRQEGKVRYFGVSNHTAAQMQFLQSYLDMPLIANQVQLSVTHNQLFNDGVVFNQDDLGVQSRAEGTVEYCRTHNITLQAWSPLEGGYLSGRLIDFDHPVYKETAKVVAEIAEEHEISPTAVIVAWILRHPAKIQVIVGTTDPQRIADSAQADEVDLTREEWYRLFEAGRGGRMP
ncbi:MAG: aldo/keto reductase [Anaerolineae bacterium]|jgi:predicted oxidoreductase|nr:aldo/keto reductase [Anaerolineae bacterium]